MDNLNSLQSHLYFIIFSLLLYVSCFRSAGCQRAKGCYYHSVPNPNQMFWGKALPAKVCQIMCCYHSIPKINLLLSLEMFWGEVAAVPAKRKNLARIFVQILILLVLDLRCKILPPARQGVGVSEILDRALTLVPPIKPDRPYPKPLSMKQSVSQISHFYDTTCSSTRPIFIN